MGALLLSSSLMNDKVLTDFEQTTNEFVSTLSSFSEDDFNTKPADGGWSAAQVGQHMNLRHKMGELLNGTVEDVDRDSALNIPQIKKDMLNFEIKMQSPELVRPEDKKYDKAQLTSSLNAKMEDTKEAIKTLDLGKACTDFVLPNSVPFTRLEWVYFIVYHTQRHTHQLQKLRQKIA